MVSKRMLLGKDLWDSMQVEYNSILIDSYGVLDSTDQCLQLANWLEYAVRCYDYFDQTRDLDIIARKAGYITLLETMISEGLIPKGVKYKVERQNFGVIVSRLLSKKNPSILIEEGGGFAMNFIRRQVVDSRPMLCFRLTAQDSCKDHLSEFWNRVRFCSPLYGWSPEMKRRSNILKSGMDADQHDAAAYLLMSEYVATDYLRIEFRSDFWSNAKYLINSMRCADRDERMRALDDITMNLQYRMSYVKDGAKKEIPNKYRIAQAFSSPSSAERFLRGFGMRRSAIEREFDKLLKMMSNHLQEKNKTKQVENSFETQKIINLNEVVVKLKDEGGIVERSLKKCSSRYDSLAMFLGKYNCSTTGTETTVLDAAVEIVERIDALTERINVERRRMRYRNYMESTILKTLVRRRNDLKNHEKALIILFPQYEQWLIELFNTKTRTKQHLIHFTNVVRKELLCEFEWHACLRPKVSRSDHMSMSVVA